MTETRYTKDHEWVRLDGAVATVGVTDHAQEALGDGWFFRMELSDPASFAALMDEAAYKALVDSL